METRIVSPKSSASSIVPREVLVPASATSCLSVSGCRELKRTLGPARAHNLPTTPPILPEPTMAMFICDFPIPPFGFAAGGTAFKDGRGYDPTPGSRLNIERTPPTPAAQDRPEAR